jgi:diacylglycerol kinase (ATP)
MSNTSAGWLIIANPHSGRRRPHRLLRNLEETLSRSGITCAIHFTRYAGHAAELAAAGVKDGFRQLIAIGGDGTLHEILNGVYSSGVDNPSEITLAVVPSGTGNDWARNWGITAGKEFWNRYFTAGIKTGVDIGVIESESGRHYFLNAAGLGFDGDVVHKTHFLKQITGGSPWVYGLSVFLSLFSVRFPSVSLKADGLSLEQPLLTLCAGNGRFTGGGLQQTPLADPTDGFFDIMAVHKIKFTDVPSLLRALFDNTLHLHPAVFSTRCTALHIGNPHRARLEADGKLLPPASDFDILIIRHGISMLIPAGEPVKLI